MIDITNFNPLILEIPLIIILLLGLIIGLKDGIVRRLFDLALFLVFILLMVFAVPNFATYLEQSGVLKSFISENFTGDFANFILSILSYPLYVFIAIICFLIIYLVIKLIANIFIRLLFHRTGVVSRFLGGLFQITINVSLYAFLLVFIASPTLFNGGKELIDKTIGAKTIYKGVEAIQNVLKDNDQPYSVESFLARKLAGPDATLEDIKRYESTLYRVSELLSSYDQEEYVSYYVNSDGTLNQEKAPLLVDDVIVFSELINQLPDGQKDKYTPTINDILTQSTQFILDQEGEPRQTIEVSNEQKESLNEALNNLEIDQNLIDDFNKCLSTEK